MRRAGRKGSWRCPVWPDWCGFGGVKIGQGFGDGAIIFTRIRRVEFSARFCGAMGRGAHLALGDVVHVDRDRPQGVLGVRPLRRIVPVIQDIAQLLQLRKGLHRELLACVRCTLCPVRSCGCAAPSLSCGFRPLYPPRSTANALACLLSATTSIPTPETGTQVPLRAQPRSPKCRRVGRTKNPEEVEPLGSQTATEQTRAALKLPRQIARPRRARQSGRGGHRAR